MFLKNMVMSYIYRRSPISVAAAVIYMITQLSEDKKLLKGNKLYHLIVVVIVIGIVVLQ